MPPNGENGRTPASKKQGTTTMCAKSCARGVASRQTPTAHRGGVGARPRQNEATGSDRLGSLTLRQSQFLRVTPLAQLSTADSCPHPTSDAPAVNHFDDCRDVRSFAR